MADVTKMEFARTAAEEPLLTRDNALEQVFDQALWQQRRAGRSCDEW